MTVVEEENVPETDAVSKSMESMIQLDGAGLIFATSFGYFDPFMLDMAKKYPDVQFRHAAGLWTDKNPTNAGSYYGYLDQGHYIDGVAAGLSHQVEQARLRRRQADRHGAAQHQLVPDGRQEDQPGRHACR